MQRHTLRSKTIFGYRKLFKNDEKCLLFHRKSSCSENIYIFCLDVFVMYKNCLIRMIKLISKFLTSQLGNETIAIHILPSISRNKGNQTMEFGQLTEYNMRNIFLETSYTKCDREALFRPFSKNSKLSVYLDIFLHSLFLLYAKLLTIKIY